MMLIDPPSPFSPLAEWREFIADMESLLAEYPGDPDAISAIDEARDTICRLNGRQTEV